MLAGPEYIGAIFGTTQIDWVDARFEGLDDEDADPLLFRPQSLPALGYTEDARSMIGVAEFPENYCYFLTPTERFYDIKVVNFR